jgi:UDP-2-acetamido-2,6-beta-L-arabino-hexul-4-ose reductase
MLRCIQENQNNLENYCKIEIQYNKNIKDIAALLLSFKETRNNLFLPDLTNDFNKKLYSTYLSYLQKNDFIYDLVTHSDYRGSFTEFIKTQSSGQISVNVSKPLTTKGNHWHNTKNEKFLVVSGIALVKFRNIESSEVLEYYVSGEKLQVIDIPVGYVHNIINIGNNDLITIMWANEIFDPQNHDTHKLEV